MNVSLCINGSFSIQKAGEQNNIGENLSYERPDVSYLITMIRPATLVQRFVIFKCLILCIIASTWV